MAALVIVIAGAQVASGRIGTACLPGTNNATFTYDDPGLKVRTSVSYNEDFMGGDKIAGSYRGTSHGTPTFGAGSCNQADPYATVSVVLGNLDDKGRLDAKKPASLDSQATDPVPSFVAATIDGGGGADVLRGHKGQDTMYGRKGNDVIRVKGGGPDIADCGPGRDTAIVGGADQAIDCERSG
jgi:Ca2+-binding RTX toxin-like protein